MPFACLVDAKHFWDCAASVLWLSHHIHNFTQTRLSISHNLFFHSLSPNCLLFFLCSHSQCETTSFILLYMFLLYFISVIRCGRWRPCIYCPLADSFFFRCVCCMHMVNIFMFWAKFCALTKRVAHSPPQRIYIFRTWNCWTAASEKQHQQKTAATAASAAASARPKNGTPKVCDMCLIMNASECPHSLFLMLHTHMSTLLTTARKTIYNECKFSIHAQMDKMAKQKNSYKIKHEIAKEALK